jgi:membrane protein involved in colicin uptake
MSDTSAAAATVTTDPTNVDPATNANVADPATTTEPDAVKPTETVEFWKQQARENEKRAKANADAAKRLEQIEEANQSEAEKAAKRLAQAEQDATAARAEALRFRIATRHGISDEDADTFLTGTDEDTLMRQAQRLVALAKPGTPAPDPSQGSRGQAADPDDMNQRLRAALGRGGQ